MHAFDCKLEGLVRDRKEPTDAVGRLLGQMQSQGLDKNHQGDLLRDKLAPRLSPLQFLPHSIKCPAPLCLSGFRADVHDRWEQASEKAGMPSCKGKVAANDEAVSTTLKHGESDTLLRRAADGLHRIYRAQRVIGSDPKGESARQQKAVACVQLQGVLQTFHGKPATTGHHRIALDAIPLAKSECPSAA